MGGIVTICPGATVMIGSLPQVQGGRRFVVGALGQTANLPGGTWSRENPPFASAVTNELNA
jgi:hypothetical protein